MPKMRRRGIQPPQYIMKGLDDALWQQVKMKALDEQQSVKDVILRLLRFWLDDEAQTAERLACEWGFRAGEKGWNLEHTLMEFERVLNPAQSADALDPYRAELLRLDAAINQGNALLDAALIAKRELAAALNAVIANHCGNEKLFCSTCTPARALIANAKPAPSTTALDPPAQP